MVVEDSVFFDATLFLDVSFTSEGAAVVQAVLVFFDAVFVFVNLVFAFVYAGLVFGDTVFIFVNVVFSFLACDAKI